MKRIGEVPSQKFSVEGFFLQIGSEIKEHDKTPGGTVPCEQLRIISAPLYISIESTKNEGEADLYDYGFSVLEQYELTVKSTARTRGGLLCQTDRGPAVLREQRGSGKKLQKQQELLLKLEENGCLVDTFLENKEGELISTDRDGISYTLQRWYEGRECDTRSREQILQAVGMLAGIHKEMKLPTDLSYMEENLNDEYQRHNQELRKIRRFIRKKGPACAFEKEYLKSVEWFLARGELAVNMLRASSYADLREKAKEEGTVCHGEYNQHNVLILKTKTAVTGFSHWCFGIQIGDLYHFMRKILEKSGWNINLAEEMLKTYHRIRPISAEEWENLKIRFTYPEKFWKLSNYYYTHNKAWISEKNTEKLQVLIRQKEKWEAFGEQCFKEYNF